MHERSQSDVTLPPAASPAPSGSRTSRSRIISNSLSSLLFYLVTLPLGLAVSSFVVHRIGLASFGVWTALTVLLGYGGLLDLGVTSPLVKYVAEYMALGRERDLNILLNTAMCFFLALGAVFLLLMALASSVILVDLFHTSPHDTAMRNLYLAITAGFVATLVFSVLRSLIMGLQRADIVSGVGLLATIVSSASSVVAVGLGYGVNGLAVSWLLMSATSIAAHWVVAKRLFPTLVVNPLLFRWSCLKMIMRFGVKIQASVLSLTLNEQVDRTLIAYFLGPVMLGYYGLAARAAVALRSVSFALMQGILPAASDLAALQQTDRLQQLYLRTTRYLAVLDFGFCAGAGGLALPLVAAWLGPGYSRVAVTLMVVLAGYAIWLPNQPTTDILNGIERPDVRMRGDLAFLTIHVPLSLFLIWRFGYYGTVVGTVVALSATRIYVYVAGARTLNVRAAELFRESLAQPAIGALLALIVVILPQWLGLPFSLASLLAEALLFAVVYGTYTFVAALDAYDRDVAYSIVAPLVRRLTPGT